MLFESSEMIVMKKALLPEMKSGRFMYTSDIHYGKE